VSENLDLVRSIYADWGRGDFFTNADWADPNIEFIALELNIGTGKGLRTMAELWSEFLRTWDDYRVEASDYRELDDERVLVLAVHHGHGRASGVDASQTTEGASLFHIRDGAVTRLVIYAEKKQALADLGLEE
jgi:ketosteroid isomerase-like protein